MNESHHDAGFDGENHSLHEIEQRVRAAGNYVRVSEDLRPRTLEAARNACDDTALERRVGGFFVCVLLMFCLASPFVELLGDYQSRFSGTTSGEVQRKAAELSQRSDIGPQWGMCEAFSQLRQSQANRFRLPR
ncbi:hypothetical protein RMSM_01183 [Rhodopirellula maiorica SM1]|uniref:Uncharacterized protein n=1 Tax=Rhodopirellula maiorica SM1 TaxID=1265738 RepID=M5S6U0_9BACT|nr:hypothetical protein [Rhodopirellula maiorica]EMI21899.1 hypothetical protein RMSM_01183 [Rhodopirellula maiorica SM1]